MTILLAAAVHKGDKVVLPDLRDDDEPARTMIIAQIRNSDPRPGEITWVDKNGLEEVVSAIAKIEVLEMT